MSASVRLSRKAAQEILRAAPNMAVGDLGRAYSELQRALAPKPKSSQVRKTERKRRAKREETRDIYEQVAERAGGRCEACRLMFTLLNPGELDHFRSRRHGQSVESCWLIHGGCHRQKTNNVPSAEFWLRAFIAHCERHGYRAEASRAEARLYAIETTRGTK